MSELPSAFAESGVPFRVSLFISILRLNLVSLFFFFFFFGSEDEGLGLFGFDLSSAETSFGGWEKSWMRDRNQYMAATWGHGLQKKLENLSAAPDELDHACRDARLRLPFPCFA